MRFLIWLKSATPNSYLVHGTNRSKSGIPNCKDAATLMKRMSHFIEWESQVSWKPINNWSLHREMEISSLWVWRTETKMLLSLGLMMPRLFKFALLKNLKINILQLDVLMEMWVFGHQPQIQIEYLLLKILIWMKTKVLFKIQIEIHKRKLISRQLFWKSRKMMRKLNKMKKRKLMKMEIL